MRADTVVDAASLTKILAVWWSIGTPWEDSVLDLDQPLGAVTARQLLTHTAGVPLRAQLKNLYGTGEDDIRRGVLHEELHRPPGEAFEYTDRAPSSSATSPNTSPGRASTSSPRNEPGSCWA